MTVLHPIPEPTHAEVEAIAADLQARIDAFMEEREAEEALNQQVAA